MLILLNFDHVWIICRDEDSNRGHINDNVIYMCNLPVDEARESAHVFVSCQLSSINDIFQKRTRLLMAVRCNMKNNFIKAYLLDDILVQILKENLCIPF